MDLDKKQLDTLEQLGRCQFSIDDVAIILEVKVEELRKALKEKSSNEYKRYTKGKLEAEFDVRKNIIDLATRGSSQAHEIFMRLRNELKIDEA